MTSLPADVAEQINDKGKEYGNKFVDNEVSATQLQKLFREIKQAEHEFRSEDYETARGTLLLLKPHLVYAAARHDGDKMEVVKETLTEEIDRAVENEEQMEMFFKRMEATVAYHKYYDDQKEEDNR